MKSRLSKLLFSTPKLGSKPYKVTNHNVPLQTFRVCKTSGHLKMDHLGSATQMEAQNHL